MALVGLVPGVALLVLPHRGPARGGVRAEAAVKRPIASCTSQRRTHGGRRERRKNDAFPTRRKKKIDGTDTSRPAHPAHCHCDCHRPHSLRGLAPPAFILSPPLPALPVPSWSLSSAPAAAESEPELPGLVTPTARCHCWRGLAAAPPSPAWGFITQQRSVDRGAQQEIGSGTSTRGPGPGLA
jgi:hypothetical protein